VYAHTLGWAICSLITFTHVSTTNFKSSNHNFHLHKVFLIERKETCTLTLTQPYKPHSVTPIQTIDFIYENTPTKITINRPCPQIQLAGLTIGPYEEGTEHQVKHWIAQELQKTGIATIKQEEQLDIKKLNNIHWKESGIVHARQLTTPEPDFYPKLRRYLTTLKKNAIGNPEKMHEYQKVVKMAQDIVNVRLQKIVSLASSPPQTNQTLKDLATEEHTLYQRLHKIINEWKNKILKATDET